MGKGVYHQGEELDTGIFFCKSLTEWQLPRDLHSSGKELLVHCTSLKSKP